MQLNDHLQINNFKKVFSESNHGKAHLVRKGQVGDWKNYFSEEISKKWDDWIAQNTQYQIISDDELQLAMPDADHGAVFNYNSQTYFLSFGARSNSYGGRFCSIAIVDGEHSDMELLVKNDFQTFKLEDETKIGSSQVTLYRGWLPGFKEDIGMGIQSAPGASVLSIFVAD